MTREKRLVLQHYEQGSDTRAMVERVWQRIEAMDEHPLSAAQLASLDQFHIRGLVATAELAQLVEMHPRLRVLDAGSGLGGPSRYLAETFGCVVDGVDLTPSYVELSQRLAQRSSATDRLTYQVGDIVSLPFDDGCFDVVWTQHVLMNVHDRAAAYAEFHRVLKTGGKLACYDVIAGIGKPELDFPVPWATDRDTSCLLTESETVSTVKTAGFELVHWIDVTRLALNWFGQPMHHDPKDLSLAWVLGPRMKQLANNLFVNLREGRVGVAMGIFVRNQS
jgi:SAM-dependent methyltransferase